MLLPHSYQRDKKVLSFEFTMRLLIMPPFIYTNSAWDTNSCSIGSSTRDLFATACYLCDVHLVYFQRCISEIISTRTAEL